jgi:hypothetical protein
VCWLAGNHAYEVQGGDVGHKRYPGQECHPQGRAVLAGPDEYLAGCERTHNGGKSRCRQGGYQQVTNADGPD